MIHGCKPAWVDYQKASFAEDGAPIVLEQTHDTDAGVVAAAASAIARYLAGTCELMKEFRIDQLPT